MRYCFSFYWCDMHPDYWLLLYGKQIEMEFGWSIKRMTWIWTHISERNIAYHECLYRILWYLKLNGKFIRWNQIFSLWNFWPENNMREIPGITRIKCKHNYYYFGWASTRYSAMRWRCSCQHGSIAATMQNCKRKHSWTTLFVLGFVAPYSVRTH